jgi:hypothetical protein
MRVLSLLDLPANARVNQLVLSSGPDGQRIAAVAGAETGTGAVRWLALPDGTELARRNLPVPHGGAHPTLSPDGRGLAYLSGEGNALWYERPFDTPPLARGVPQSLQHSLAFHPVGIQLFGVGDGVSGWGTHEFFGAEMSEDEGFGARFLYMSEGGADGRVSAVAASGMYAMSHSSGDVSFYYGGDWSGFIEGDGRGPVTAMAFADPGGDRLIVAHGKQVGVYRMVYEDRDQDFDEVKRVFALPKHPATVTGIAVAPDGGRFVTACADGSVRVWGPKKGPELAAFDWQVGELTAVALAPDGTIGAAGTADGRVVLWDLS